MGGSNFDADDFNELLDLARAGREAGEYTGHFVDTTLRLRRAERRNKLAVRRFYGVPTGVCRMMNLLPETGAPANDCCY
jgi:hypothetical protein